MIQKIKDLLFRPNALVVDDMETNALLCKRYLNQIGFNVIISTSPVDAFEIAATNDNILYVFSDFQMPEMDGIELMKKISEYRNDVHFFLVTADYNSINTYKHLLTEYKIFKNIILKAGYTPETLREAIENG